MELETPTLERLIEPFATSIHVKAAALRTLSLTLKQARRFKESMLEDLKKCSDVLIPDSREVLVSARASAAVEPLGIDLRKCGWHDQPSFDPRRRVFHWEHVTPLAQMRDHCLTASAVTDVSNIVSGQLFIAWITKSEDHQLTVLGFKSKRPDPGSAYAEAGIQLLDAGGHLWTYPR